MGSNILDVLSKYNPYGTALANQGQLVQNQCNQGLVNAQPAQLQSQQIANQTNQLKLTIAQQQLANQNAAAATYMGYQQSGQNGFTPVDINAGSAQPAQSTQQPSAAPLPGPMANMRFNPWSGQNTTAGQPNGMQTSGGALAQAAGLLPQGWSIGANGGIVPPAQAAQQRADQTLLADQLANPNQDQQGAAASSNPYIRLASNYLPAGHTLDDNLQVNPPGGATPAPSTAPAVAASTSAPSVPHGGLNNYGMPSQAQFMNEFMKNPGATYQGGFEAYQNLLAMHKTIAAQAGPLVAQAAYASKAGELTDDGYARLYNAIGSVDPGLAYTMLTPQKGFVPSAQQLTPAMDRAGSLKDYEANAQTEANTQKAYADTIKAQADTTKVNLENKVTTAKQQADDHIRSNPMESVAFINNSDAPAAVKRQALQALSTAYQNGDVEGMKAATGSIASYDKKNNEAQIDLAADIAKQNHQGQVTRQNQTNEQGLILNRDIAMRNYDNAHPSPERMFAINNEQQRTYETASNREMMPYNRMQQRAGQSLSDISSALQASTNTPGAASDAALVGALRKSMGVSGEFGLGGSANPMAIAFGGNSTMAGKIGSLEAKVSGGGTLSNDERQQIRQALQNKQRMLQGQMQVISDFDKDRSQINANDPNALAYLRQGAANTRQKITNIESGLNWDGKQLNAPKQGDVVNGYKFIGPPGSDATDQKFWVKVK